VEPLAVALVADRQDSAILDLADAEVLQLADLVVPAGEDLDEVVSSGEASGVGSIVE